MRLGFIGCAVLATGCLEFGPKKELAPLDQPGDRVPLVSICNSVACAAWSGDSKTLFLATASRLYRVNPETRDTTTVATFFSPKTLLTTFTGDRLYATRRESSGYGLFEITTATGSSRRIATVPEG